MRIIERIKTLPGPLKVVFWLHAMYGMANIIDEILTVGEDVSALTISGALDVLFPILIAYGILWKSQIIRFAILLYSLLGITMLGIILVDTTSSFGMQPFMAFTLIPVTIFCISIWALLTAQASAYYGRQPNQSGEGTAGSRVE